MQVHTKLLLRIFCAFALVVLGIVPIWSQQAQNQARQKALELPMRQIVRTKSGIVVLSYAPQTQVAVLHFNGGLVQTVMATDQTLVKIPLQEGTYEVRSGDDVLIVSSDLNAYNKAPVNAFVRPQSLKAPINKKLTAPKARVTGSGPGLQVLPVPWVADSTYASSPPSNASRHVVFQNAPTRLKVAVKGGAAPYTVVWDPGDGSGQQSFTGAISTNLALSVPVGVYYVPVNSADGFSVGDNVVLDTGMNAETMTITGFAPRGQTQLAHDVGAGATIFTVFSSNNIYAGDFITIGGETLQVDQTGTASSPIQTGHSQTTLSADAPTGTTDFQVADATGFNAGDTISIDGEFFTVDHAGGTDIVVMTASFSQHNSGANVVGALPAGTMDFPVADASKFQVGDGVYTNSDFFNIVAINGNTISMDHASSAPNADGEVLYDANGYIATKTASTMDHFNGDQVIDPIRIYFTGYTALAHTAGAPLVTTDGARVGYNGLVLPWTYTKPVGSLIHATVTITDSMGISKNADYWIRVGDPFNQADRVARSTDEGLWYLHAQLNRQFNVSNNSSRLGANEPSVDEAYITNTAYYGVTMAPTAMFAISLENSGHSIEGGVNFSHLAAQDAFVDDLNLMINFLTDTNSLTDVASGSTVNGRTISFTGKTYASGKNLSTVDTHPAGGNGYLLMSNTYRPIYEGGMHLQAIAQAGFVDKRVPNRSEYSSYYDLIGDFVDGFQYSQAVGDSVYGLDKEGGWRYDFTYGDSDGSAVAWAAIGLRSAELANTSTPTLPNPYAGKPITVDPLIKSELKIWLTHDQQTNTSPTYNSFNYSNGQNYTFHTYGGMGYQEAGSENAGKTGGGIVALKYVGYADTDAPVVNALDYLFRNFYTYDYTFGWSSARDSYGMYNMLKGLTEAHVTNLTQSASPGVTDSPGNSVTTIPWYSQLADFIAGTGQMIQDSNGASYLDLGHQDWPGNHFSFQSFVGVGPGHYEPTGTRSWRVGPLNGEWGEGASDSSADVNLVTAWDLAILTGQVFTSGPVANFGHPTGSETTVPETVNGQPFFVVFDPGGSTDKNPNGTINKVTWDFGDGSAPVTYMLTTTGPAGGAVPLNISGNRTTHNYTFPASDLPKTVSVTLTVYDDQGLSDTKTEQLTVVNGVATPVARFSVAAVNSRQNVDNNGVVTVGIIDAGSDTGKVTIQFDGSASANPNPAGVNPKKNANGISSFGWEWPTAAANTASGDTPPSINPGKEGGDPSGLDEGAADTTMTLNSGSKAPVQSYTFYFGSDSSQWPTYIQVSLKVQSNLPNVPGVPTDNNIVTKIVKLLHNSQMPVTSLQVRNLTLHNITDTTAVVSFDTTDSTGVPVASTGRVNYGTTSSYGSHADDTTLRTHHDITLSSLTANTLYHFSVHAEGGTQTTNTADSTFKTLVSGVNLVVSITSTTRQNDGSISVVWRVTNNGAADATNFTAYNFGATSPAKVSSINGKAPPQTTSAVTLTGGGGYTEFTVVYTGVPTTSTYFFAKFSYSYTYNGNNYPVNTGNIKVSGF